VALALAATLGLGGCATPGSSSSASFLVTGYAESDATSSAQLAASAAAMTQVGIDGVNLTSDGAGVTEPDAGALRLLAQAHAKQLKASLLFGNYSDAIGDFSDPLAERMFDSSANIRSVVAALVSEVKAGGWDGVTVDLESLNGFGEPGHLRDDNAGLVAFVTALHAALGSRSLAICVSATTGSYADLGYDLPAIGRQVNDVVLMAYDQHGPQWSKAGPVGGFPWVKQTAAGLMRSVPAARVQLGIAEYGYTWPKHGTGTNYSDSGIRALVKRSGATPVWSASQLEWHATFADGEQVWWSDARSYRARLALAHTLGLAGVAVWSLGDGDPL
jgi:spore germination protein